MKKILFSAVAVLLICCIFSSCAQKRDYFSTIAEAMENVPCRQIESEIGSVDLDDGYTLLLYTVEGMDDRVYYIVYHTKDGMLRIVTQNSRFYDFTIGYDRIKDDDLDVVIAFSTNGEEEIPEYEERVFTSQTFKYNDIDIIIYMGKEESRGA